MNFANHIEDGTQSLQVQQRNMLLLWIIIFSMGNVTAMTEHQKGSRNLLRCRGI